MARDDDRPRVEYFVGLDIGPPAESTALAVVERTRPADPDDRGASQYAVRHLQRFPPGTAYGQVLAALTPMFAAPPLKGQTLVLDLTAVGKPVLDLVRRASLGTQLVPVAISAGHHAEPDERGHWQVPRKVLASTLQILLQERRLRVSPQLAESATLVDELTKFRVKVTAVSAESLDAWREGPHDDLVLSVAIAVWQAERNWHLWVVRFIG